MTFHFLHLKSSSFVEMPSFFSFWYAPLPPPPSGTEPSPSAGAVYTPDTSQPHHGAGAGGGGAEGKGAGGAKDELAAKDAEMKKKDAEIALLKAQLARRPAGGAGGAGVVLIPPTASRQGNPFQNTVSPPGI